MLAENYAEVSQVLRDAFEDAVLMGVNEAAMRQILADIVAGLDFAEASRAMKSSRSCRTDPAVGSVRLPPSPPQSVLSRCRRCSNNGSSRGRVQIQQPPAAGQLTGAADQQTPAVPSAQPPLAGGPPATMERPNTWLPAQTVKLQALDKVNAQTAALTIKVGTSATFGSLTIAAKACMVRPTDQPADAAAFLAVTDSHADSPGFNGWMLQDEPSVSMMEHPIYDLRVTGCA